MHDLYTPEAYFSRVDALYLDGELRPALGRARYLRRRPWRRLRSSSWAAVEGVFVFSQLMRLVPDAALRREYRRRLWNAVKRRPLIDLLRQYCVNCAMHYHCYRLVQQMRADRAALEVEIDDSSRESDPNALAGPSLNTAGV